MFTHIPLHLQDAFETKIEELKQEAKNMGTYL